MPMLPACLRPRPPVQVDSMLARTCQSANVTVSPPAAFTAADLSKQLQAIDLAQLNRSADSSAVVQAALQVVSLLSFANSSNAGSNTSSSTGSTQQNSLITMLASSGNANDPDQMNNLIAAGAKLAGVGNLSPSAGVALVNMFG